MKRYSNISLIAALAVLTAASLAMAKTSRRSNNAWLGVITQSVDYDLAEEFDLSINYGAIVNEVVEDSPAEEAGIEEGDIIIRLDGFKITDSDDLSDKVEDGEDGDKMSVVLVRDNEREELNVTLGKRPRRMRSKTRTSFDSPFMMSPSAPNVSVVPRGHSPKNGYYFSFGDQGAHGHIGVSLSNLSEQLGEFFGVEKGRGALINEIEEDSPAEESGLRAGDVIVGIDGEKVYGPDDVVEVIEEMVEEETVKVTVIRNKNETTFEVAVVEEEGDGAYIVDDDNVYTTINIPRFRGRARHGSLFDENDFDFLDSDDFLEGMEGLRESLEELRSEDFLNQKNFKLDRTKLKRELKQLQKELNDLQGDLE